jgi:hypothetical protein
LLEVVEGVAFSFHFTQPVVEVQGSLFIVKVIQFRPDQFQLRWVKVGLGGVIIHLYFKLQLTVEIRYLVP